MTIGGFNFDSYYLPGNERCLRVDTDNKPLFVIEPVVGTPYFVFHADYAPEAFLGITIETFDRAESFCTYGISIDYQKLFHIHRFVAVNKTDGECYRVDGAARYAKAGHLSEALQDLLGVIARDRQSTQGRFWWHVSKCIGTAGCKNKEE
jgi:hypothetical protein